MTKTTTTAPAPPTTWPRTPRTSQGMRPDLVEVHASKFYERYAALGLPVPDDVTAALAALTTAIAWEKPNVSLAEHRTAWRDALLAAARAGADQPDAGAVIDAALRASTLKVIDEDLTTTTQVLHDHAIRTVRRSLDVMLGHVQVEHDRLATELRALAGQLPASVRSAVASLRSGHGDSWLVAVTTAERLAAVRDMRQRVSSLDHAKGADEYVLWKQPRRLAQKLSDDPTVLMLDVAIDEWDAQPWCPSRSQVEQHVAAVAEAQRQAKQKPRGPVNAAVWAGQGLR